MNRRVKLPKKEPKILTKPYTTLSNQWVDSQRPYRHAWRTSICKSRPKKRHTVQLGSHTLRNSHAHRYMPDIEFFLSALHCWKFQHVMADLRGSMVIGAPQLIFSLTWKRNLKKNMAETSSKFYTGVNIPKLVYFFFFSNPTFGHSWRLLISLHKGAGSWWPLSIFRLRSSHLF